jgi:anti-sigma factor RsiW
MTCETAPLHAYFDGELDAAMSAAVTEHIASCDACRETYARLESMRNAIRNDAPYYDAPPELAQRITRSLRKRPAPVRQWLAIAAAVAFAVSLGANLALLRRTQPVEQALVEDHIRSLIGSHLLDVPSTDQHTVKPWFNGKLDFAPDVRDFAAEGFPLVGGRIDYAAGRPIAALVYHRRAHTINLFTWPDASSHARSFSTNGYNVLHWTHAGLSYFAVSDVTPGDLERLRDLYK